MKALTYIEHGKFVLLDKPEPEILDPRDAVVRVTLGSICTSDLHIKHGTLESNKRLRFCSQPFVFELPRKLFRKQPGQFFRVGSISAFDPLQDHIQQTANDKAL